MTYSSIFGNSAGTPDHRGTGGGLYTYGNAQVEQSTISRNRADAAGARAARSSSISTASIVNSTISGNSALARTGGISTSVALTLYNSSVAFNHAAYFNGGIFASSVPLTLHSSVVADNITLNGRKRHRWREWSERSGNSNLVVSSTLALPTGTITCVQVVANGCALGL